MASPSWALDLPQSGRVRIRVHTAYRHKSNTRSGIDPMKSPMGSIEPFEVVSGPIEINIAPRVIVEAKATGKTGRAGTGNSIEKLLSVAIRGMHQAPAGGGRLSLDWELQAESSGWRPSTTAVQGQAAPETLEAGASHALVGGASAQFTGLWEYPKAETVSVRAAGTRQVNGKRSVYRSEWIEVSFRSR